MGYFAIRLDMQGLQAKSSSTDAVSASDSDFLGSVPAARALASHQCMSTALPLLLSMPSFLLDMTKSSLIHCDGVQ